MSSYEDKDGKIEIGDPVIYGKHNTTVGLDDILFLPPNLSSMLDIMFEETKLSKIASYDEKQCGFTFIHFHGLFALLQDEEVS
jgi:hypothetical protein